ncbi:hypothetical protein [Nocardia sp. NBC_01327]|uniref:hypothetical protein n=1 Tax=Nocardia sp. NBC_01327 TaxID=2903593 RepID=UPI002E12C899|nr:hypothetical protein OG326_41725 [Nocardia sp. NBC_01327]
MLSIFFVLFVFPGLVGAVAGAQSDSAAGTSGIDGLSWMNIHDSQGVPLANYQFVTDHGGNIFDLGNTVLWMLLGMEVTGYLVIVITAIWIIGYAMSFQWLSLFSSALHSVAHTLTATIATPAMLVTAATFGAFCVAWFALRGYHAKATMQIVTMLAVAILGSMFLADPLADVLSPDGLLAQGRDVGISVASGLNGDANPDPGRTISGLQGGLADNFARDPLQFWNFGHVVDDQSTCGPAWTAGMNAGTDSAMRAGLQACGDEAAVTKSKNPSFGQVGTGLILLICSTLLLVFAVFLSIQVIKAALDSIYHGFLTIFGFAAGGFIYGPTQTFLVRNVVHSFVSAVRMTAYVVFLGFYMVFIGNIFQQSQGHVMAVLVTAGIVEVIAISQLKHLTAGINKGNDWIANRFASAVQNGMANSAAGAGGGGGGGTALGMGTLGAHGTAGGGLMTKLAILTALNANPAVAHAFKKMGPFNPQAGARQRAENASMAIAPMNLETHVWSQLARDNWMRKAEIRAPGGVGPKTDLEVANMLDGWGDSNMSPEKFEAAAILRGATPLQATNATRATAVQKAGLSGRGMPMVDKAISAANAIANHTGPDDPIGAIAGKALVAANNLVRNSVAPQRPLTHSEQQFVDRVERNWDSDVDMRTNVTPEMWGDAGQNGRREVSRLTSSGLQEATQVYNDLLNSPQPVDPARLGAARMDVATWTNRNRNVHHEDRAIQGPDGWG